MSPTPEHAPLPGGGPAAGPRFDLVTLGETMLRLSPPRDERLETAPLLECHVGGCESNTAMGLACLGFRCAWISRLTDDALGRRIARSVRAAGVDVSGVVWTREGRVGKYFLEYGRSPRQIDVIYDRAGAAINFLKPDEVSWDLVRTARLLHLSGITAALGQETRRLLRVALERAREARTRVSFDLNFRARLWDRETAARELGPLMSGVDLLIATEEDLRKLYGFQGDSEAVIRAAQGRFGVGTLAMTRGRHGASAMHGTEVLHAPPYEAVIVDRVGAGDAFAAGFLSGFLQGDVRLALARGNAMAALKSSVPGDCLATTTAEVDRIIAGESTGIQR